MSEFEKFVSVFSQLFKDDPEDDLEDDKVSIPDQNDILSVAKVILGYDPFVSFKDIKVGQHFRPIGFKEEFIKVRINQGYGAYCSETGYVYTDFSDDLPAILVGDNK